MSLEPHRVTSANWNPLSSEDTLLAARHLISSHFPAWSERMVLRNSDATTEDHKAARWFRWEEKLDGAWTGTWVAVKVPTATPGIPLHYFGYVAQPRSLDDVEVTERDAVEIAIAEARRRGLEDVRVSRVDLYLDNQFRHFPHYIIIVGEPEPRGKWGMVPLQIDVIVHAVSAEVVGPYGSVRGDEG
ncbi:MAG: hypothetical protein GF393_05510 [Armatimonadia bacterium]|nr:hypothetical protein [Armatimonadia bacterium]